MTREEAWLLRDKYGGCRTADFARDCARLAAGEPLAYVIGWIPFCGCEIDLSSRPLIPRPETEYWTERAIAAIAAVAQARRRPVRVLDLCAGSGAIGAAVARAVPAADVAFAEINPAHTPTIHKNFHRNAPHGRRASVYIGDLFSPLPTGTKFDFILSNPPYIDPAADTTAASVRRYEPAEALYGGAQGIACCARILAAAGTWLTPAGQLWLEHDAPHAPVVREHATAAGWVCATHQDQYGHPRYLVCRPKTCARGAVSVQSS